VTDKITRLVDGIEAIGRRMDAVALRHDAQIEHVATIAAFPNKFGSFTGAFKNRQTGEVVRERFPSLSEAQAWAKKKAWDVFGPVRYAALNRKGEYESNVWKDVK
jgi:hypothetical protein